jgi:hypothetical protein
MVENLEIRIRKAGAATLSHLIRRFVMVFLDQFFILHHGKMPWLSVSCARGFEIGNAKKTRKEARLCLLPSAFPQPVPQIQLQAFI